MRAVDDQHTIVQVSNYLIFMSATYELAKLSRCCDGGQSIMEEDLSEMRGVELARVACRFLSVLACRIGKARRGRWCC